MKNIKFFALSGVKYIHEIQINKFGGLNGIRDLGLLNSAIAMPKMTFDGEYIHKNLIEMSAAYIYHLIKNHPFVDANKRTGIVTGISFLRINNVKIFLTQKRLFDIAVGVANSSISKDELIAILKKEID